MKKIVMTLAVLLILVCAGMAQAEPFTYTDSVTGSGSLNGMAFTNAMITFTATADSSNVTTTPTPYGNEYLLPATVTVTVNGVGTGTFTDSFAVTSVGGPPFGPRVDFQDETTSYYAIITVSSSLNGYNLQSAIGPISSPTTTYSAGITFGTTDGGFSISSLNGPSTFTATPSAVPEPSSLAMCGLAGLIGSAYAWRRRKRSA